MRFALSYLASVVTGLLVGGSVDGAQFDPPPPVTPASRRAVGHVKASLASAIDSGLPAVAFERWVAETLGSEWVVTWQVSIGHWARERVLAEDRLYVELVATPRTTPGEIRLAMLAGTFGGLRPVGLDYGSYWREGIEGRESGWLADLGQLSVVRDLVLGRPARSPDVSIGRLEEARHQLGLIARAQATSAAALGVGLPDRRLGTWVREVFAPDVAVEWEVSVCDLKASEDVCVQVSARQGRAWAKVHVRTGTDDSPWSGQPSFMPNGLAGCAQELEVVQELSLFPVAFRQVQERCR